jgi:hypothetical protein
LKDSKAVTVYTKDAEVTVALENTLVELKFDGDGVIDLPSPPATTGAVSLTADEAITAVTATKLTTASTNYVLNSNTIYLKASVNATDSTKTTVTVGTAADVAKGSKVAVKADAGVAKYVVVTTAGNATDLGAVTGLYLSTSKTTTATGSTYSVKLNVNGEEKTFAVSNEAGALAYDQLNALTKYDLVKLTDAPNSNNSVYEVVTSVAHTAEATSLTANNDAKTILVNGTTTYVVTADTQIFLTTKTFGSVSIGSFTDLRVAADTGNYGNGAGKYKVVVQASGTTYGGIAEAGVIIVKAY